MYTCRCADVDELSSKQKKNIMSGDLFFWKYKTTLSTVDSVVLDFQTRSVRLRTTKFDSASTRSDAHTASNMADEVQYFDGSVHVAHTVGLDCPYLVKKYISLRQYCRPRK
jgi:hypothetical protein